MLDIDGDNKLDMVITDTRSAENKGRAYIMRDVEALIQETTQTGWHISLASINDAESFSRFVVMQGLKDDDFLFLSLLSGNFDSTAGFDLLVNHDNQQSGEQQRIATHAFYNFSAIANGTFITLKDEDTEHYSFGKPFAANDFDKDGTSESASGASVLDNGTIAEAGEIKITFSKSKRYIKILGGTAGEKISAPKAIVNDINQDGELDLFITSEKISRPSDNLITDNSADNTGGARIIWNLASHLDLASESTTTTIDLSADNLQGVTKIYGEFAGDETASGDNRGYLADLQIPGSNYDSILEIIMHSPSYQNNRGAVYVVRASETDKIFNLQDASNSPNIIKIIGANEGSQLVKNNISLLSNVSNKRNPDFIIAAENEGAVYVLHNFIKESGIYFGDTVDLGNLGQEADNVVKITGPEAGFGGVMVAVDINADGYSDLVLNSRTSSIASNEAYVVFGGSDFSTAGDIDFSADADPSSWAGRAIKINGVPGSTFPNLNQLQGDNFLAAMRNYVVLRGDMNGDGLGDTVASDSSNINITTYTDSGSPDIISLINLESVSYSYVKINNASDAQKNKAQDLMTVSSNLKSINIMWGHQANDSVTYDFSKTLPNNAPILQITSDNAFDTFLFSDFLASSTTDAMFRSPAADDGRGAVYLIKDIGRFDDNQLHQIDLDTSQEVFTINHSLDEIAHFGTSLTPTTSEDGSTNGVIISSEENVFSISLEKLSSLTSPVSTEEVDRNIDFNDIAWQDLI